MLDCNRLTVSKISVEYWLSIAFRFWIDKPKVLAVKTVDVNKLGFSLFCFIAL